MKFGYFVFLIILPILIFFHTRGVVIHDEGYILNSSLTPDSLYLTSLSFLLFSPSIFASRILMILISLISSFLMYKVVFLSTKNKTYSFLSVILFIAWGPSHFNFSLPATFSITSALLTLYLFLKFIETKRTAYLFTAGAASFSVFLFKQNFGFAILIPALIFFIFIKERKKILYLLDYIYGYVWSFILFSIYLLSTDSFASFVLGLFGHPLNNAPLILSPIYQFKLPTLILKITLLLPFILWLLTALLLIIRKRYQLIFLPIFVIVSYVAEDFSKLNYSNTTLFLSLMGILLSILIRFSINSSIRLILYFLFLALILIGFYIALLNISLESNLML